MLSSKHAARLEDIVAPWATGDPTRPLRDGVVLLDLLDPGGSRVFLEGQVMEHALHHLFGGPPAGPENSGLQDNDCLWIFPEMTGCFAAAGSHLLIGDAGDNGCHGSTPCTYTLTRCTVTATCIVGSIHAFHPFFPCGK